VPPADRHAGRREGFARGQRGLRSRMERAQGRVAAQRGRPRVRRVADGTRGRAGQVRPLDRSAGDGHQSPAGRLRVRPLQLIAEATVGAAPEVLRQHVSDPEICIRCNTCEEACPVNAITHDSRNYVVDPAICKQCMACVPPCPTGAIDNWRMMLKSAAYPLAAQFEWDELPAEAPLPEGVSAEATAVIEAAAAPAAAAADAQGFETAVTATSFGATVPPWSAAHPYTNLYGPKNPTTATVVGNYRVTELGTESDTHHIVLDFGSMPFPVLEGQSIGILPPGVDDRGKPHVARQYSIAS